jgi:putative DNA primase/helicase
MARFKSYDEFLDLFPPKPRQKIKNGCNVLCPAHNDKNPSLSVSHNNGKILLDCKAGCELQQILASLNLTEVDLFLNNSSTPTIEAIYDYQDVNGELLFQTLLTHLKTFGSAGQMVTVAGYGT